MRVSLRPRFGSSLHGLNSHTHAHAFRTVEAVTLTEYLQLESLMHGDDLPELPTKPPWMARGACVGKPQPWFFPARGESTAEGKAVCSGCPVRAMCLGYALEHDERDGHRVWGGLSARERTGSGGSADARPNVLLRRPSAGEGNMGGKGQAPAPCLHGEEWMLLQFGERG